MKNIQLKFLILIVWLCFLPLQLFAQGNQASGTIMDAETKESLPFANIGVLGTHKGTVSNSEGNFVLDLSGIASGDTILIQYIGYETLRLTAAELQKQTEIYLSPAPVNMKEVQVLVKSLSAEELIKLAYKNFETNHSPGSMKQRFFFHNYAKVPMDKQNKLVMKETDFVGLDKKTFDELLKKMPKEFIQYQDAIADLYSYDKSNKLVPVKGISLEEGSQQALLKEFEDKLGIFFEDIGKSMGEKDIYYKVSSGILSKKIGNTKKEKEEWNNSASLQDEDSLNYTLETSEARTYLISLLQNYTNAKSDNWEFLNSTGRYTYAIEEVVNFNDETVYKIVFTPKKKGLFEGAVFISASSYAVLQVDFAFAKGKRSEVFKLFGFQHSIDFREGHIIFEKGKNGYYLKYMYAGQHEFGAINRSFSVTKKEKRFLVDKELNEMKMEAQLYFHTESNWELLVLEREEINAAQFEKVQEPSVVKFKKEYAYTPEMWENRTVLVPATELKKYKRR